MGVLFMILGLWIVLAALVALVALMARRGPEEPVGTITEFERPAGGADERTGH